MEGAIHNELRITHRCRESCLKHPRGCQGERPSLANVPFVGIVKLPSKKNINDNVLRIRSYFVRQNQDSRRSKLLPFSARFFYGNNLTMPTLL